MTYTEELVTNTYGRKYWIYQNDSFYQQRIANAGPYQKQNLIALRELVPKARTILDIGMNIGMNTIEYATFADIVHGFEPTPQTYNMAIKNIELNKDNFAIKNWFDKHDINANTKPTAEIITHNFGLGNTPGFFDILIKKDNAGHNHIDNIDVPLRSGKARSRKKEPEKVTVEVKTVDSLEINDIDIIKVDVEGYEFPVVLGAEDTIVTQKPIVQLEMVEGQPERFGYTCQQIIDWFYSRGFKGYLSDGTNINGKWFHATKRMERFFIHKDRNTNLFPVSDVREFFEFS